MVEPTPFQRPIRWEELRADEVERIIRERAQISGNVIFGNHAFERVEEREITEIDARRILRTGMVEHPPTRNKNGKWEAVIAKRMRGTRCAGVVTIVFEDSDKLFVKTVQWMDWKQ